jgi:ribokinase/sulfofructose kinase
LACARVAREARDSGTVVSADIDDIYDGLPELLPLIDILITSKEFPRRLTGIGDGREALREVKARYGCAVTGMTLGERGVVLYHEGRFVESPAFPVPGAVAALKCRALGALTSLPSVHELNGLLTAEGETS